MSTNVRNHRRTLGEFGESLVFITLLDVFPAGHLADGVVDVPVDAVRRADKVARSDGVYKVGKRPVGNAMVRADAVATETGDWVKDD